MLISTLAILLTSLYVIIPLMIWSTIWKGRALWEAGTRKEKKWFICIFVVNTLGILEIIYLFTRKDKKAKRRGF